MENFIYNTPTKIYFGKNQEKNLHEILKSYSVKKILLHYGMSSIHKTGLYEIILQEIQQAGVEYVELGGVSPNPKLSLVLQGIELCKREQVDLILAVGGGSVIDSAKCIAVGAKTEFSPWLFHTKEQTPKSHIPVGAVLTIAAAGSDMSNSCVITNDETMEKRGFTSEENRCLFAILNPELTYTVSPYQTACGIVDILMHTLERYFSKGEDTPLTDNIALGLLKAVIEAGRKAISKPNDYDARATLMWANSLSHNGLTGCGRDFIMSVHQLEHEISGMYDTVAHGAGLAVLWPAWAKIAYKSSIKRFERFTYEVMGIEKTSSAEEDILKGITALQDYFKEIGMPTTLRELNIPEASLEALAYNAMYQGKRTLKDIIEVDYSTALNILKMAF